MTVLLSPDTRVIQRSQVRSKTSVPGQFTLIDASSGQAHQLNATASLIWSLAESEVALASIVQHIRENYEVDLQQVHTDVSNVVLHLSELNVLEIVNLDTSLA